MPGKGWSWELQAEDKECQRQQQHPEEKRQGPVLYEALMHFSAEGIWEAESFREHSSHGRWVFLRLPQLPDGNPLEYSLNTPVHTSQQQPPQGGSLLAEVLAKAIVLMPFLNIYFRMSLTEGRVEGAPNLIP